MQTIILANQVINQMSVSVLCITVFIEKRHRSRPVLKRLETDLERSTILSWILVLHLLSTANFVSKTNSVTHEISSVNIRSTSTQLPVKQTSLQCYNCSSHQTTISFEYGAHYYAAH